MVYVSLLQCLLEYQDTASEMCDRVYEGDLGSWHPILCMVAGTEVSSE